MLFRVHFSLWTSGQCYSWSILLLPFSKLFCSPWPLILWCQRGWNFLEHIRWPAAFNTKAIGIKEFSDSLACSVAPIWHCSTTDLKGGWYDCHPSAWVGASWTFPCVSSPEASPGTAGGWWCWVPFPGYQFHVLLAPAPAAATAPRGSFAGLQHGSAPPPMYVAPAGRWGKRRKKNWWATIRHSGSDQYTFEGKKTWQWFVSISFLHPCSQAQSEVIQRLNFPLPPSKFSFQCRLSTLWLGSVGKASSVADQTYQPVTNQKASVSKGVSQASF